MKQCSIELATSYCYYVSSSLLLNCALLMNGNHYFMMSLCIMCLLQYKVCWLTQSRRKIILKLINEHGIRFWLVCDHFSHQKKDWMSGILRFNISTRKWKRVFRGRNKLRKHNLHPFSGMWQVCSFTTCLHSSYPFLSCNVLLLPCPVTPLSSLSVPSLKALPSQST